MPHPSSPLPISNRFRARRMNETTQVLHQQTLPSAEAHSGVWYSGQPCRADIYRPDLLIELEAIGSQALGNA